MNERVSTSGRQYSTVGGGGAIVRFVHSPRHHTGILVRLASPGYPPFGTILVLTLTRIPSLPSFYSLIFLGDGSGGGCDILPPSQYRTSQIR